MFNLKPLNSKEVKNIINLIKEQWDAEPKLDFQFFTTADNSIQIVNREFNSLPIERLKINSAGLYLGQIIKDSFRLSIEGSQLIGKYAKKNVLNLTKEQAAKWIAGEDLDIESEESGFMIIKYNDDFLGAGKLYNHRLANYIPKSRRTNIIT